MKFNLVWGLVLMPENNKNHNEHKLGNKAAMEQRETREMGTLKSLKSKCTLYLSNSPEFWTLATFFFF